MYCKKCGTKISDDSIYCFNCGCKVVETISDDDLRIESVVPIDEHDKMWKNFAKLSQIFGIVGFALCWTPFFIGLILGLPAIVFGALGRKAGDKLSLRRSAIGRALAVPACMISFIMFAAFITFVALEIAGIIDWGITDFF